MIGIRKILSISLLVATSQTPLQGVSQEQDPFDQHNRLLADAIRADNVGRVQALLKTPYIELNSPRGCDKRSPFLFCAVERALGDGASRAPTGTINVLVTLLDAGADPNIPYYSANYERPILHVAAAAAISPNADRAKRALAIMAVLIDHGADVDAQHVSANLPPFTPLALVVAGCGNPGGSEKATTLLIDAGADVNSLSGGITPLAKLGGAVQTASHDTCMRIAEKLVKNGADIKYEDPLGLAAVDYSLLFRSNKIGACTASPPPWMKEPSRSAALRYKTALRDYLISVGSRSPHDFVHGRSYECSQAF